MPRDRSSRTSTSGHVARASTRAQTSRIAPARTALTPTAAADQTPRVPNTSIVTSIPSPSRTADGHDSPPVARSGLSGTSSTISTSEPAISTPGRPKTHGGPSSASTGPAATTPTEPPAPSTELSTPMPMGTWDGGRWSRSSP